MSLPPKKAFVLAAGLGERMRPLTNNCPKPLLAVDGKPMLDRCLDALAEAGVEEAVVNTFYLAPMIEEHLKSRQSPQITISSETELLDTGGGVKKKLEFFGDAPFYVLNADVVWTDGKQPALKALADKWDPARMDVLLLLYPIDKISVHAGKGDYYLAEGSDRPVFAKGSGKPANYIFTGPRIVHPRLFEGAPEGAFSFLELFHKAEKKGRLYGLRHSGEWYHVGTPEALEETNRILSARREKKAVS
ncbi:MAG: nucleotidyltransferase family protein [Alphaproteobacteria bacterium]|nr:nucleotidyltransferase family protein [Alphaproteobacteria bacterium]